MPDIAVLWAKSDPPHPLWKHLLDAAAVSLALPSPAFGPGWTPEAIALLVGLHDVGKADSRFQHQVREFSDKLRAAGYPPTADAPCRHERISAGFIENELKNAGLSGSLADALARAVVAHHGYWDKASAPVAPAYEEAQQQLCKMLRRQLRVESFAATVPPNLSAFGMRIAGHVVLSDWIASNDSFLGDARLKEVADPEAYFVAARQVAADRVRELGFERDRPNGMPARVVDIPRPIQQKLLEEDIPPGLVIIEAPMGEGKTEAAWMLAEKWRDYDYRGIYMALPTMATSDSLHERYQHDYLDKLGIGGSARLVHGMAWLRDEKEPEMPPQVGEPGDDRSLAAAWFRPTRRAMLAAHGVGTVDQAMLAGMNVKFGFLRLYGLADRVLVIDEVHAYDAYMRVIIGRLLQWCACLGIPVILLSATLSAGQRAAMLEAYGAAGGDPGPDAPYPLITAARVGKKARSIPVGATSSRTLRIETHLGLLEDAEKTAALAAGLVADGGCCCVILNTVKQAQAVYRDIKLPEAEKLLFHARFKAEDRERITKRVLSLFGKDRSRRPARFVLVATQIVEQSLDVDFDHMVTEIAPIDLLLQRSGRLHRHCAREFEPALHVLVPRHDELAFGGSGHVYADKPLLRTLAILANLRQVHLPEEFRRPIEMCYGSAEWDQDSVPWEAIREADRKWGAETQSLESQGRLFLLREPRDRFFDPVGNNPTGDDSDDGNGWRAKTRLGANDRTAVLVEEDELLRLEPGELRMEEVRDLYRRAVKLPGYLPFHSPAPGFAAGVEARGKLKGLMLLPLSASGSWHGIDGKGVCYEVAYDSKAGLVARRAR